jgi:hypothetical protein
MTFKIIRPQTIEQTSEFSRASTATYYDQDGVLQTAAVDELRIGYDPSDLDAVPLPVLEDAATNNFINSQDGNLYGIKSAVTYVANAVTGIDGSLSGDSFTETAVSSGHYIERQQGAFDANSEQTYDVVFKPFGQTRTYILTMYGNAYTDNVSISFNVTGNDGQGEITSTSARAAQGHIQKLQDGWWRVALSGIPTDTVTPGVRFRFTLVNSSTTYLGSVDTGVYLFNSQNELGAVPPSSIIISGGTAATRAADIPGDMLTSSVPEDDHPEYDVGDTYALGDRVISTTTHRVYESLQAGNLGNPLPVMPEISTAFWLNVSATNRWKMFDNSITSQSSAAEYLSIAIQTVGRVDSVALLNISASSVRITMEDATEGIVYDETYSLIEESGILDYYEYFFEPVSRVGDFAITDMDLYSDTTITITLSEPSGTVLCGAAIVGLSKTIGATRFGMSLGIQDYSVKITDEFGNKTILERVYSDKMSLQVSIPTASVVSVKKTLASYRATAIVYIATDEIGAEPVIAYGYFNDFNEVIDYLDTSVLNIEIESLT